MNCRVITTELGAVILVSECDYEWLNRFAWFIGNAHERANYYATANIDGKFYSMHRMILGLQTGDDKISDHINGVTLDNRRENLRIVTAQQNCWNVKRHKNNGSGFAGVCFHKGCGKWQARIYRNGQRESLGYFETVEQAAAVYSAAHHQIKTELFHALA